MSQNRIMLSMNRRRLLWWCRILLLIAYAFPVFSLLVAIIWDAIWGVGSIPLWLIFLNRDVGLFLICFSPVLYLIAHHPFGKMVSGLSNKNVVLAKVSFVFMLLAWIIYIVYFSTLGSHNEYNFVSSTILQIDSEFVQYVSGLEDHWSSLISIFVTLGKTFLGLTVFWTLLVAPNNYEKFSGWKIGRYWTLKFPPEEYPPFSKYEKDQMENGETNHAS